MLTESQCETLEAVWLVANDFRVIEYAVREVWREATGTLYVSCAYGTHHKQAKWLPAGKLFATAAEAYRASAAMMRDHAAALLAEADRREQTGSAGAADFYSQYIKAGAPAAT